MSDRVLNIKVETTEAYDVIVVGGGPAGLGAAAAASKNGCKVLLIEGSGCLGGTASNCGLPLWLGNPPEEVIPDSGLYRDFVNMLREINPELQNNESPLKRLELNGSIVYDPEIGKLKFDEFLEYDNLKILYFTTLLAVDCNQGRINGVYTCNKNGVTYFEAKAVIDCTGDADVASLAGFETFREESCAPVSLLWQVEDVDEDELKVYLSDGGDHRFRELIKHLRDRGVWKFPDSILGFFPTHRPGVMLVNPGMGQVNIDGTDAAMLSEAVKQGRKMIYEMLENVMKPYIPGFKNASVRNIANMPGVRETRKIKGVYTLTYNDIVEQRHFDDTVVISYYGFDLGRPERMPDGSWRSEQPLRDHRGIPGGRTCLPYRCLVPEKSVNLLVAGRCVSAAEQALGPVRVMLPCFAAGLAAGAAATQIVNEKLNAVDVDIKKLRSDAGLEFKPDFITYNN